jgi:hypothetical protein
VSAVETDNMPNGVYRSDVLITFGRSAANGTKYFARMNFGELNAGGKVY